MISASRLHSSLLNCVAGVTAALVMAGPSCAADLHRSGDVMVESPTWLNEVKGERALRWVGEERARTLKTLKSQANFKGNFEIALSIQDTERPDSKKLPVRVFLDGEWVYHLLQDSAHQRGLWRRTRVETYLDAKPAWEPLLDVDELARAEGKPWLLLAGNTKCHKSRCLLSLSNGGRDAFEMREFDLERRAFVPNGFRLPETSAQSVVWRNADTLWVASNWGPDSLTDAGTPMLVKEWRRGQPFAESTEVFRGRPDGRVYLHEFSDESGEQSIVIAAGSLREGPTYFAVDAGGAGMQRIPLPRGAVLTGLHRGQWVFLLKDAPWRVEGRTWPTGSLMSIPVHTAAESAESVALPVVIARPGEVMLSRPANVRGGVLLSTLENVRGRLWKVEFRANRWSRTRIDLPDFGTISIAAASPNASAALVTYENFTQPPTLYSVDCHKGVARAVAAHRAQFDADRYITEQLLATSVDGTKIPYFIVRSRSLRFDGRAPTILRAYGASGALKYPLYDPYLGRLWLDMGGVYVQANVRGGGELGPHWHVTKTDRRFTYADFFAVAEDLIRRGITSPRHLGIRGHSQGGLLVGVALNERPELFSAAVIENPVLDLIDAFVILNGVPVRIADNRAREHGSLEIEDERAFIEKTSPLQNLRKNPKFPMPFIATSTTDQGVPPTMARKYAYKLGLLQIPYLFLESPEGGHDAWSTPKQHAEYEALVYTYLSHSLF